jgi:hypothetical protein
LPCEALWRNDGEIMLAHAHYYAVTFLHFLFPSLFALCPIFVSLVLQQRADERKNTRFPNSLWFLGWSF